MNDADFHRAFHDCTSTEPVVTSRIFGGEAAINSSRGWAISVHLNYSSYCTGTLISSSWVLVSAIYFRSYHASELYVSAATNTLMGRRQWQNVSAIYIDIRITTKKRGCIILRYYDYRSHVT